MLCWMFITEIYAASLALFVVASSGCTAVYVINSVCLTARDASSPRPGGTFAFLWAALALQLGALDLRLQQRHTAHQLLQLSAGSVRPVRLPTLVLIQTTVSRGHLKRPVHLTGSDRRQQKTRPFPIDYVAA